jgi:hypothetical protein
MGLCGVDFRLWGRIRRFASVRACVADCRVRASIPVRVSRRRGWSLWVCPVSLHSSAQWMSGQGFFNTEEERGPRRATEKKIQHGIRDSPNSQQSQLPASPNKAPQAILQANRIEIEQQAHWKTAHAQIGLQLLVMHRQQCSHRLDCQNPVSSARISARNPNGSGSPL